MIFPPGEVEENIQIKKTTFYSKNKFFYFSPPSYLTNGVWIGTKNSDSEITVDFGSNYVKVLNELTGTTASRNSTVIAFFDTKGRPETVNILAKDIFIKRIEGGIICAEGNGRDEAGTVNIQTTDSIYLLLEKKIMIDKLFLTLEEGLI